MIQEIEYEIVFEGTLNEVEQVKDILQKNNIDSFLKNENMGQLFPLHGGLGGIKLVQLLVNNEYIEKAKEIIKRYFG